MIQTQLDAGGLTSNFRVESKSFIHFHAQVVSRCPQFYYHYNGNCTLRPLTGRIQDIYASVV